MVKRSKRDNLIEAIRVTEDMKVWEDAMQMKDEPEFASNPYLKRMVTLPTTSDFQALSETTKQMLFDWYKDNLKVTLMGLQEN